MSVTNINLHWQGQTGTARYGGRIEYTAVWEVLTNDPLDGPLVVGAAVQSLYPMGVIYNVGNDTDPRAILRELTPQRAEGRMKWFVVGKYNNDHEQGNQDGEDPTYTDENGDPTDDPLKARDEIETSPAKFSVPVEKAINRTTLPGRPPGTLGPVVNSALMPFDPPLERDATRQVIRITQNRAVLALDPTPWEDAINSEAYTISLPHVPYGKTFDPYTLKFEGLHLSSQLANGKSFLHLVWEFHHDRRGFRADVLDRGYVLPIKVGEPDGKGGFWGSEHVPPGGTGVFRPTDAHGNPLNEPILLDGNGRPLPRSTSSGVYLSPPVYLTYSKYDELPFSGLPLSPSS